jgi:hypothetical protein
MLDVSRLTAWKRMLRTPDCQAKLEKFTNLRQALAAEKKYYP